MDKFKKLIGDTIVLYYEDGSAVMGILKSVRIIQDSDREKPFILAELEIGNNTFSFDLNEAIYWYDVTLFNENTEKDLDEKFSITSEMTNSEILHKVAEEWKSYDKEQKENISKLIMGTKWEMFAELMGAYHIWKDESARLHKEIMKLLDEKKADLEEKYKKVGKELEEKQDNPELELSNTIKDACTVISITEKLKNACAAFYNEGRK